MLDITSWVVSNFILFWKREKLLKSLKLEKTPIHTKMAGFTSIVVGALLLLPVIASLLWRKKPPNARKPPSIDEMVPFVSNVWQFMTEKRRFIARVR